jgi:hypothetical protein
MMSVMRRSGLAINSVNASAIPTPSISETAIAPIIERFAAA